MKLKEFKLLAGIMILLVLLSGCIGGQKEKKKVRVYVTPCMIVDEGSRIKVNGLTPKQIKRPLAEIFLDDLVSPSAKKSWKSFKLSCRWALKKDEVKDNYYCEGRYKAPELDENDVIKRWVNKGFKIGFKVEKHGGETWIDLKGKKHVEKPFYYLQVDSVKAKCWVYKYV